GEVKVYRDGDTDLPTICGTGLEDYVGSAWGLGRCHAAYSGAPLLVHPPIGRGEGVPRRRHRPADDLRHRARGLRRQRVGPRPVSRGVLGRAAPGAPPDRARGRCTATATPTCRRSAAPGSRTTSAARGASAGVTRRTRARRSWCTP